MSTTNTTRRSLLRWGGIALISSPLVGILTLSITGPSLLEKQRQAARREGIPLTPEDLRPNPPIPDSENAGPLLKELTRRYNALPKQESSLWEKLSGDLLKTPEDTALQAQFQKSISRYAELIQLAEVAAERPHCDLAYDWSLGPNLDFPEFAILRQFARVFRCRALLATEANAAWADISRTAKLGNLIGETPCLIAALVAVAIYGIADRGYIETLKRFGPSAQAHETLASFGPPPIPEFYFKGEVIMGTATMKLLREGKLSNLNDDDGKEISNEPNSSESLRRLSISAPIVTAFWEKQLLVFWRGAFAQARKCEHTGDYEALGKWFDATVKDWERDKINLPQNLMVMLLAPAFSQATNKTHIATLAQRRLRETALALVEEKAKTGAFPDAPTLPADPFSSTQQPLRYKKDGEGCLLYSVGQDHTDDGGVEKREKTSEKLDMVVRL